MTNGHLLESMRPTASLCTSNGVSGKCGPTQLAAANLRLHGALPH